MKLRKNQNGFSAVEVLLLLIFLAIIAFAGYYVYHAQKKSPSTHSYSATPSGNDNSASDVFTSDDPTAKKAVVDNQIVFKYPQNWTLTQTPVTVDDGSTTQDTKVAAPDGRAYVEIKRQTAGVGGAFCTDGNNAASYNITDVGEHTLTDDNDFTLAAGYSTEDGPFFSVVRTADADKLKEGSNTCSAFTAIQQPAPLFSNSDGGYEGAWVKISSPSMDAAASQGAQISENDYKSFIGNADFNTAVTIVQTIKKL